MKWKFLTFILLSFCFEVTGQKFEFLRLKDFAADPNNAIRWTSLNLDDPLGYSKRPSGHSIEVLITADSKGKLQQKIVVFTDVLPLELANNEMLTIGNSYICRLNDLTRNFVCHFDVLANQEYEIEVDSRQLGIGLDPTIEIFDYSGRPIFFVDDSDILGGDIRTTFKSTKGGKHSIEIKDVDQEYKDDYYFVVTVVMSDTSSQPDIEKEFIDAVPIQLGINSSTISRIGHLRDQSDVHRYQLELENSTPVSVSVSTRSMGSDLDVDLSIIDMKGNTISNALFNESGDSVIALNNLKTGKFVVEIKPLSGVPINNSIYRLRLSPYVPKFSVSSRNHLITIGNQSKAELKVNVAREDGYKETVSINIDESVYPNPGFQLSQNLVKDEAGTLELSLPKNKLSKGIYPIMLSAQSPGLNGYTLPVDTSSSLKESGLRNNPRLTQKLNGILFISVP